ncbi:hypothetical protein CERZMDRAFT_88077 [Cercospora zeae-maydis SCOH1-5]|uniref:Uncharacterized protein n=1 Tax=Cercospora zeae-maydis SCOH1-5 TaxID=717836 RepID=A0A6A6F2N1_9PEZI|nr:hypothetical protein CERZMDRAFT_88077 [Cercospora zeae-maydis SCOH1-5]
MALVHRRIGFDFTVRCCNELSRVRKEMHTLGAEKMACRPTSRSQHAGSANVGRRHRHGGDECVSHRHSRSYTASPNLVQEVDSPAHIVVEPCRLGSPAAAFAIAEVFVKIVVLIRSSSPCSALSTCPSHPKSDEAGTSLGWARAPLPRRSCVGIWGPRLYGDGLGSSAR